MGIWHSGKLPFECQKLDKLVIFFNKLNCWKKLQFLSIFLKKISSFWQFFNIHMAIFWRVRWEYLISLNNFLFEWNFTTGFSYFSNIMLFENIYHCCKLLNCLIKMCNGHILNAFIVFLILLLLIQYGFYSYCALVYIESLLVLNIKIIILLLNIFKKIQNQYHDFKGRVNEK